jgi:hypothetical protein
LFRSDEIYFIEWLLNQKFGEFIFQIRAYSLKFGNSLPEWFLFSLPDALWLLSLATLLLNLWKQESIQNQWMIAILIPLIAIFWEFGQFFKVLSGTFDWVDIEFYIISSAIIFFKLKSIKHEKTNVKIN